MKKFILICALVAVFLWVLPIMGFAEELDAIMSESPAFKESVVNSEPTEENFVAVNKQHTVFSRLLEYFTENKKEVLTVIGDSAIVAFGVFIKLRNDKKTRALANDVKTIKGDASGTFTAQNNVINVVNEMVDGYNGMRVAYDKNQSAEDDRNRLIGAVMVQNTAILETLNTVYINNKNLPQGVKDLVTLQYANCLKALNNDELICSIVKSVREKISDSETFEENAVTEVSEV